MKIKQIAIAFDQLLNTFLGGYADETISSRCYRLREFQPYGTARVILDAVLSPRTRDHCEKSYENRMAYVPSP